MLQKIVALFILAQISVCSSLASDAPKAIIIGASSGMGREVAKLLSAQGYAVGLAARRVELLESLQAELHGPSFIKKLDVTQQNARNQLTELINEIGGLDLIVISISAYLDNRTALGEATQRTWLEKERTLQVDALGFIALADIALEFFRAQKHGHFVGISSTSGQRGSASNPEYSAAKACIDYYMEGKRNYFLQNNLNVQVTNVIPGFVAVEHSPLGQDPSAYWEITTQEAGKTIVEGILSKQKIVYVPPKAWLIALLLKWMPDYIYNNYFSWL